LLFGFYLPPLHVSVVKRQKASNKYRRGFQRGNDSILEETEEEKEDKEELEEELRKKRVGTEREDQHEGHYQILDQSVHKRLRKMYSK
jgi:hypothetical protein